MASTSKLAHPKEVREDSGTMVSGEEPTLTRYPKMAEADAEEPLAQSLILS